MKQIDSFKVNHDNITKGMYVSRVDGDIVTYDIRMKVPNGGDYLKTAESHTLEHILATLARNSEIADSVIYVGPMGCRTGFYLILRDNVSCKDALNYVLKWLMHIVMHVEEYRERGIPGATRRECGNYLEHDMLGAYAVAMDMIDVLIEWSPDKMRYQDD